MPYRSRTETGSRSSSNTSRPALSVRQLERPAVQILPVLQSAASQSVVFGRIQAVQQLAAFLHSLGGHGGKQLVGRFESRHGRVIGRRADEQRAVAHAQMAAGADIRAQKTGSPTHLISQT